MKAETGPGLAFPGPVNAAADPPDPLDSALCDELLSYLREHPRSMDSLEGIAGWWLPRHHIRTGVERVARCLVTLTEGGFLEEVSDGDRRLYRVRPDGDAPPAGPTRQP